MCRSDDADPVHRQLQDLCQGAVHVVDDLRRRPQRHLAVDKRRDGAVLLHRQMRVALKEEDVLADMLGATESAVDVSELERHELVDVVGPAVVLDPLVFRGRQCGVDRHHRLEDLVLDVDRVAGGGRDLLLGRRDRGDRVADVADLLVLEGALVLRHRQDPKFDWQVGAGDHCDDARDVARRRGVDGEDACVWVGAAQDLAVEGARGQHVVRVDRAAGDLGRGIDLGKGPAHNLQMSFTSPLAGEVGA